MRAAETVDPTAGDPVDQIRGLTAGIGPQAAVETAGGCAGATAALVPGRLRGVLYRSTCGNNSPSAHGDDVHGRYRVCNRSPALILLSAANCPSMIFQPHRWTLDEAVEASSL